MSLDPWQHVHKKVLIIISSTGNMVLKLVLLVVLLRPPFHGPLSGTTWVSQYKKRSPTHTYPDHQSSFICFLHLLRSTASTLFNLCAWQSFCTTLP